MNTNTTIMLQLMSIVRTLEAELSQVLRRSVGTWTKEDESSTGCVWDAKFHHITTRSRLTNVLKLMNRLFLKFSKFFFRAAVNRG